jgi:uncharacterized protein (DUF427 family)
MPVTGHATATAANGTVLAEAKEWEVVEGNIYFPPDSIKHEFFASTELHTTCPWKGEASYYTINVDGASYNRAS